jgi:hypothetical protein
MAGTGTTFVTVRGQWGANRWRTVACGRRLTATAAPDVISDVISGITGLRS